MLAMGTSAWPSAEGEMAERIAAYNWAATPLGAVVSWPQCLKTAVDLMLASGFPTAIQWGYEGILLYNDAEARILGQCHPAALGQPVVTTGRATLPRLEGVFRRVVDGESVIDGGQRYFIRENDAEREIWADHLASPIRNESGAIAGLWMVLIDVTAHIQAERRRQHAEDALRKKEEQHAFLFGLSDALRVIADPGVILTTATRMTVEHFGASRSCYAEFHGDDVVHRGCWICHGVRMPERFAFADLAVVAEGYFAGHAVITDDIESDPHFRENERDMLRAAGIAAFVCVPLRKETVFGVQSGVPRVWTADEVDLIREAGERTLRAARRARAEAALRDSEARFRQFAEASPDILWIGDANTLQLEYWSQSFEWDFGDPALGRDNLKNWLDIVVAEDREQVLATFTAALSGARASFECRVRRPRDGEIRWIRGNVFPLLDGGGSVQRFGSVCHDATREKATAARLEIMVAELQHRTRNLMAVLQSIVAQTLAACEDPGSFKMRIDEQLVVLSRVHDLLSRSEQEPITIGALIRREFDAAGGEADRVEIVGPEVRLRNSTVQMLALALHELATEARRHGALSSDHGRLRIGWEIEQIRGAPCLRLTWIEERPVCVGVGRDRRGYGRELIERALPYSLNAETCYEVSEAGLRCTITLPLTKEGPKERGE
jgi:PAS domain S-box-containing protein